MKSKNATRGRTEPDPIIEELLLAAADRLDALAAEYRKIGWDITADRVTQDAGDYRQRAAHNRQPGKALCPIRPGCPTGLKKTLKKLPEHMMTILRKRRNLDEDDTSKDAQIEATTPTEIVRECAAWRLGDQYWVNILVGWMAAAGAKPDDFDYNLYGPDADLEEEEEEESAGKEN